MGASSPRGYYYTATGGYGGGYLSSDVNIWHKERDDDEKKLEDDPDYKNLVSLTNRHGGIGIVDSGLKNKKYGHHTSIELKEPFRKPNNEKQNSRDNSLHNSCMGKVRWKDEQGHQNVWLHWGIFSRKVKWNIIPWLKDLVPIFAAIWNDKLWDPTKHPKEQPWDRSDHAERKRAAKCPPLITKMTEMCSLNFSAKHFNASDLLHIDKHFVRTKCTSSFSITNAALYIQHYRVDKSVEIQACKQSKTAKMRANVCKIVNKRAKKGQRLPPNWYLVRLRGIPSKWIKREARTASLLFDLSNNELIDRHCNCKGGQTPVGCSHCTALMWVIGEEQGNIPIRVSASVKAFQKGILIPPSPHDRFLNSKKLNSNSKSSGSGQSSGSE